MSLVHHSQPVREVGAIRICGAILIDFILLLVNISYNTFFSAFRNQLSRENNVCLGGVKKLKNGQNFFLPAIKIVLYPIFIWH